MGRALKYTVADDAFYAELLSDLGSGYLLLAFAVVRCAVADLRRSGPESARALNFVRSQQFADILEGLGMYPDEVRRRCDAIIAQRVASKA